MKEMDVPFIMVPENVLRDERLNSTEKLIFGKLNSLSAKKGFSFATNEYMAANLVTNMRTISNGVSRLRQLGYIEIENPKSFRRRIRILSCGIERSNGSGLE